MRVETMTPLWLDKDQISTWMAQQNKNEKDRRKVAAVMKAAEAKQEAEANDVTGDANSRPTKKAKTFGKKGKGKHKAAPKKPKAKRKRKQSEEEEGGGTHLGARARKGAAPMGDDTGCTSESDDEDDEEEEEEEE